MHSLRFEWCVFDVQVNLEQWLLVVSSRDQPIAVEFCTTYVQCAAAMGIRVAQPSVAIVQGDRTEFFVQEIRSRLGPQVWPHTVMNRLTNELFIRYCSTSTGLKTIGKKASSKIQNICTHQHTHTHTCILIDNKVNDSVSILQFSEFTRGLQKAPQDISVSAIIRWHCSVTHRLYVLVSCTPVDLVITLLFRPR